MVRASLLFLILLSLFGCSGVANLPVVPQPEEQPAPTPEQPRVFPAPKGFVNDFANVLDPAIKQDLERKLDKLQQIQKVDFAVVTVSTTGPESVDDYSLAMSKEWKIGSENGGLLLMVAIDDRTWRIQIDRKLEKSMTNDEVREIGELMVPDFKRKQYGTGITKCVEAMVAALTKKLQEKTN